MLILLAATGELRGNRARSASKAKILTRAEFDALLATPGRVILIDVRRHGNCPERQLAGVPEHSRRRDLEKHLAEIPKDRPLIVVSNHAHRAGDRGGFAHGVKGFKIAGAIGAQVYESEGGTIIKYPPEKPAAHAEKSQVA